MTLPTAQLPQSLQAFFDRRVRDGRPMVLVTVLSTSGSTYSKCGHQMLIDEDGTFQGMLSGGCLEGDLAQRARQVIASGESAFVEYDLHADDGLFGLGVGCEGVMRVLLQALHAEAGYQPFAGLLQQLRDSPVIDVELPYHDGAIARTAQFRLRRPRRILVLGAGADAEPLLQIGASLGWSLAVYDHRPGYVEQLQRPDACAVSCRPAAALADEVDLSRFDAAIVMSHHLASDRAYLEALATSPVPFIGLLGPPHRRDRLLAELAGKGDALRDRLRSPVGQQIGGRGPAPIALEIAAELQAYFCSAD